MKLIFFGTSEFAVPALKKLHESGYDIAAVVTQPDKPAGRKQRPLSSHVKQAALDLGLKVLQPEKLTIYNLQLIPDLFVVASYGKIIPKEILEIPKFGALNTHPSLLPKYRGPSPIQATILNGDRETGVTIIKLDEKMDHGDIIAQSVKCTVQNKNFRELHDELANLGAELLIKIIPKYITGEIKPAPQGHSQATYTKCITKNDGRIDWKKSADEIDRMIRAYSEWPVAWTTVDEKRLKIYQALVSSAPPGVEVGKILDNHALRVQTGDGVLELVELKLEGRKIMSAAQFARGFKNLSGKRLS